MAGRSSGACDPFTHMQLGLCLCPLSVYVLVSCPSPIETPSLLGTPSWHSSVNVGAKGVDTCREEASALLSPEDWDVVSVQRDLP